MYGSGDHFDPSFPPGHYIPSTVTHPAIAQNIFHSFSDPLEHSVISQESLNTALPLGFEPPLSNAFPGEVTSAHSAS